MTEEHLGRRIARAMITIFVFQLFWKFGGFIVSTLVFREFATPGQKHIFDAYNFAEGTVFWALYVAFDKFVFPVFLPLFSDERELRGEEEAWRFANTFANLLMAALLVAVAACIVWAPEVVDFIAAEWRHNHPGTAETAVLFTRVMLPALFFVALGSFTHALLNSYKRFAHAAAGAGMHRFIHAVIFLLAFKVFGAPAIWAALAFVLASPAKLITHGFGLRERLRNYRPRIPHWREIARPGLRWLAELVVVTAAVVGIGLAGGIQATRPLVKLGLLTVLVFFCGRGLLSWLRARRLAERTLLQKVYLLAYPVLMGLVIARIRDLVQDSYATHFETGGLFGAIKYAKKVGDAPMAIIPLALSMAMFPYLCDMFTRKNLEGLAETVAHALKMIALFFLPLTVITVILRLPVIELLASREVVDADLVGPTALALALYSFSFIFYASEMVLMQTFFSLQNTWLPTLIGALASLGQVGFLYALFRIMEGGESAAKTWLLGTGATPFIIVALAYPISRAAKNLVLGGALHARIRLFHLHDLVVFLPKVAAVSGATGLATWAVWEAVRGLSPSGLLKVVRLGVPSLAALGVFIAALFALRRLGWSIAEFDIILRWLRDTGWQKIKARLPGGNRSA
ncbi:MAG: murein biosynthesis integral membrane protein MurJ [Planctomycetota bacterium]